jgi:hypothetical protein
LKHGEWPAVPSPDPLPPGDVCHFNAPVRFGRRRADQYGHLLLTGSWLQFRGALDMSVSWSEVSGTEHTDRELTVRLHDSGRLLRFSFQTAEDAACAAVLASELAATSGHRPRTAAPQASV